MKKTLLISSMLLANFAMAADFAKNPNAQNTGTVQTNYVLGSTPVTITQNTDTASIVAQNSVACPADDDSYYRRFILDADHSIDGELTVSSVDIGLENVTDQTVVINLYSLPVGAAFELANLTSVGTANVDVSDTDNETVKNFPVAGVVDGSTHDLVVELFAADTTNGTVFFIGSNDSGQTGPTFLRSPGCGAEEPTDVAGLGFPDMHQIMVVNGDVDAVPVELMNFSVE